MVAGLTPAMLALSGDSQMKVSNAIESYLMRAAEAGDQGYAERLRFAKDQTFGGKRSMDAALGYKDVLTLADYRQRYERGGIAGRIVEAMPKYTWRGGFELVEDPDPQTETEFEKQWASLATRTRLLSAFYRADLQSQLAFYSVIVIGAADNGDLTQPLTKTNQGERGILYFSTYVGADSPSYLRARTQSQALAGLGSEGDISIKAFDTDPKSLRFGLPSLYEVRRNAHFATGVGLDAAGTPGVGSMEIHHSRVVHIAERCTDDDVFGRPVLERVWNDLDDLRKVSGGGAEAFLQAAKPQRLWSFDASITNLDDAEKIAFREQIELLQNQVTSDVRARGMTATNLSTSPAQFGPNADEVRTQIAGALGLPKRILFGSEMGELASSQDRDNLRELVGGRRLEHAGPVLVQRLADRLIEYGYLPTPAKPYEVRWGAVLNLTNDEKIAGTNAWVAAKTDQGPIFSNDEIRDEWWGKEPLDEEEIAKMQEAADARQAAALELAQAKKPAPPQGGLRAAFDPNQPRDEDGKWTDLDGTLPRAGDLVSGLRVGDHVPNTDSISAGYSSDYEYSELPGIREVPFAAFGKAGAYGNAKDNDRVTKLADAIKESGEIAPLIVEVSDQGWGVVEGSHRFDALKKLGVTSFPAVVIEAREKELENIYEPPPGGWDRFRGKLRGLSAEDRGVVALMESAIREGDLESLGELAGIRAAYDPDQPRDEDGKWVSDSSGGRWKVVVKDHLYGDNPIPKREYRVVNSEGHTVASAELRREKKAVSSVFTHAEYRRKGIASALYRLIESDLGYSLEPNAALTDDGKLFWGSRK